VSEQLIETLKMQVKTTTDVQQAKDAIDLLQVYGYKALPALRDIMQDSSIEEVRAYCLQAIKKFGWFPE
jgi:hypothetical protein